MKKQEKQFEAVLSKNIIARQVADYINTGQISIRVVMEQLLFIESFLGEMNQPTVEQIIETNTDSINPYKI